MNILATAPVIQERDKDVLLLIDADYLAYMVGAISQHKDRDYGIKDQVNLCVVEETDTWMWVDPIGLVQWRVDNELSKIKDRLRSDNSELWLTPHTGNFRNDIAVTRAYKSGRSSPRPYHYQAIRDYLVAEHGAYTALDCEADDMVCTRQMDKYLLGEGQQSIIVGIDKDLRCMFGNHYNPRKDQETHVGSCAAAFNFYGQMITGDSVDSIPGCKGRGIKFWEQIQAEALDDIEEIHDRVCEAYVQKGHDLTYLLEQANLLHMRRRVGQEWTLHFDWEEGYDS